MKKIRSVRLLGLALLLLLGDGGIWSAWPQTAAPILTVETGMHTAPITSMAVDPANRYLVTVSNDKTARVWDISSEGNIIPSGVLRPPIDAGKEGMLQAVAITPDGNTIACGGYTALEGEGTGSIYLFDHGTGALLQRLSGLPGNVIQLAYSPDGRLLAATMERTGVRLYSVPDYALLAQDFGYSGTYHWVDFDSTGSKLATACPADGHGGSRYPARCCRAHGRYAGCRSRSAAG